MSILTQKTIRKPIHFDGVGLHTGKEVKMNIFPAEPNLGIVFKRIDLNNNNIVIPSVYNVSKASFCTTISNEFGVEVSTIEHLMGAMYILGVDNALIELTSQEVPILDGSARDFVKLISETGLKASQAPIKLIKINKNVSINEGSKFIKIDKSNVSLDISFEIKYSNSLIGNQKNKINVYEDDLTDIYSSRTFCLFEDIDKLKKLGLAKGGSLNNAVVVKEGEVLNSEGLRNELEFVNHKILDCIGDIYLSGYKMIGSIECSQGGHSLTNQLLRELFLDKSNFSIFEVSGKNLPTTFVNKSQLKSIA